MHKFFPCQVARAADEEDLEEEPMEEEAEEEEPEEEEGGRGRAQYRSDDDSSISDIEGDDPEDETPAQRETVGSKLAALRSDATKRAYKAYRKDYQVGLALKPLMLLQGISTFQRT
jgi:hypothetical protein